MFFIKTIFLFLQDEEYRDLLITTAIKTMLVNYFAHHTAN